MIVITGPGRSGTSLLAQTYAEAGVHPGGGWSPDIRAGYEDGRIVQANRTVLTRLGVTPLGAKFAPTLEGAGVSPKARAWVKRVIGPDVRQKLRERYQDSRIARPRSLRLIDWDLVDEIVEELGPYLRETASETVLCKDPQFSWTLPVWITAQAEIEHVVVSYRGATAMVGSRAAAGHLRFSSMSDARNSMIYATGNVITALADSDVPHTILRFPDYLKDLDAVADQLPIPEGTTRDDVRRALKELANDASSSK